MSETGQRLYVKAKTRIPGGTQLLSKRPELYLPEQWPSYYSRAKGVEVWDLDGNRYLDMCYNGIGACILGACDPDVDAAVRTAIDAGSMSTLNAPEEVELADLLCELHPWADMVRYARCGGEAMAVAVRIARAKTHRDIIAFCGYHGWHDWYLAANLGEETALDGHLLPGLQPAGVPGRFGNLHAIPLQPHRGVGGDCRPARRRAGRRRYGADPRQRADAGIRGRHSPHRQRDRCFIGDRRSFGGLSPQDRRRRIWFTVFSPTSPCSPRASATAIPWPRSSAAAT